MTVRRKPADADISGEGTYVVGADVEFSAGRTVGALDPGLPLVCWARPKGMPADFDEIIADGTATRQTTVTVKAPDGAVETPAARTGTRSAGPHGGSDNVGGCHVPEVTIDDKVFIHAPVGAVWQAIKNPEVHAHWHPYIIRITGDHRLGAMRICSVVFGGKPGATQERCIDIEEDGQWRITWAIDDDTSGFSRRVSNWRAGFDLEHREGGTLVTAHSMFRPNNVLVWLVSPWIGLRFHHTQRTILKRLQKFVEMREER